MSSINNVVLVGRLTRDPELRHTNTGTPVCNFTLAVDRAGDMVDGEVQAGFFDVEVWDKQAETCNQYLAKGRQCGIVGNLRLHKWESKEGDKRSKVSIVGRQVQFLGSKSDGQGGDRGEPEYMASQATDFGAPTDSDIPF